MLHQSYLKFKPEERTLNTEEAISWLGVLLSGFLKTYVVIDAMDECDETFRADLIGQLRDLHINLLVTSRELPDIRDTFQGCPEISISASDEDMRLYLGETIKSARGISRITAKNPELPARITDTICEKAGGM